MREPSSFLGAALIALLVSAAPARGDQLIAPNAALKQILAGGAKTTKLALTPTPAEAKKLKDGWNVADASAAFYQSKDAAGATLKSAILVTEPGKEGPITAAVGLDAKGSITDVVVIEFAETRGENAKEASFTSQFKGKAAGAPFKLGKDVDGIAGATWTSETMATIARRASALYKVLVLEREGK